MKLEKRAEKEVLKIVHDAVQTVVELACKGQTRTAGDPAPARPLTTDQAALRGAGQDLMKRLRAAMDVRAPLTAALTAPSVVGQKKKLSVTDSVSAERPQKKLRIDSTAKPLGGSTKAATPSPGMCTGLTRASAVWSLIVTSIVASGPPRAGPVAPVTVPLGTSAGPLRSVALTAQPLKSPFASFNSDQQYSHASQRAIELQNIQDVYYKSAHVDVLAAVDSSRRRIRYRSICTDCFARYI